MANPIDHINMEDYLSGMIESDDNFDELPKINPYEKKYYALLRRCEAIQQSNERLVNRIQHVRRLVRKLQKERRFFMKRLDRHNDNYQNASLSYNMNFQVPVKQEPGLESPMSVTAHLSQLLHQKKAKTASHASLSNDKSESSSTKQTVKRKIKHEKTEKDRNAPKRPANPFLLFCQDKRSSLLEKMQKESKEDVTHQELTKGLAQSWNGLVPEDKKKYYVMYEKEKERYEKEMQVYTDAQNSAAMQSSTTSSVTSLSSAVTVKTEPTVTVKLEPEVSMELDPQS